MFNFVLGDEYENKLTMKISRFTTISDVPLEPVQCMEQHLHTCKDLVFKI